MTSPLRCGVAWLVPTAVLAVLAVIICAWYPVHAQEHPFLGNLLTGETWPLAWGRLAGLIAAWALLVQVLLVARLPGTVIPHDRKTRIHHLVGFMLVLALIAHPWLITLGHADVDGVSAWAKLKDFWATWEDLPTAMISMVLIAAALVSSILVLKHWVSYEVWYRIHLLLYIALVLAFGHQGEVGTVVKSSAWFTPGWYGLHGLVLALLTWFRVIRPWWRSHRHRFTVARLVPETADVISVHITGRDLDRFPARGGQFLIVRFLARGFWSEAHPFSISAPPDGHSLRLSIKALGDFTRRIKDLPIGTRILIDGPHGAFTAERCQRDKALLIAGGIGVTPLRALAEDLIAAGKDVTLVLTCKTRSHAALFTELEHLESVHHDRFRVFGIWTDAGIRLNEGWLLTLAPDLHHRDIFLCGPPLMMRGLRRGLRAVGVARCHLHDERFSL